MTEYEGASEYLIKKLLDHAMGKAAYTMPTNVWVAIYDGYPLGTGNELDPATATDYARVQIPASSLNAATFASPTGSITNSVAVDFGVAGADWGVITHWAVFDNTTGGNMLYLAPFEAARNVLNNDPVLFPIGELRCRMSQAVASP